MLPRACALPVVHGAGDPCTDYQRGDRAAKPVRASERHQPIWLPVMVYGLAMGRSKRPTRSLCTIRHFGCQAACAVPEVDEAALLGALLLRNRSYDVLHAE
jgi:hypothetical protein